MKQVLVGIRGTLAKSGAKEVDLLVHSYFLGRPSPCVVIVDWVNKGVVGGAIDSIEQIFQLEIANHPGYVVKTRQDLIAVVAESGPEGEQVQGADPVAVCS